MLHIDVRVPHAIAVLTEGGEVRIIEPTRPPARVLSKTGEKIERVQGIAIHEPSSYGGIVGLPPKRHATIVVVSQLAAMAIAATMPDRTDVAYPDTSPDAGAARSGGRVLTVQRLIRAL